MNLLAGTCKKNIFERSFFNILPVHLARIVKSACARLRTHTHVHTQSQPHMSVNIAALNPHVQQNETLFKQIIWH